MKNYEANHSKIKKYIMNIDEYKNIMYVIVIEQIIKRLNDFYQFLLIFFFYCIRIN